MSGKYIKIKNGKEISYITNKQKSHREAKEDFKIVGEIDCLNLNASGEIFQSLLEDEQINVKQLGFYDGRKYKTIGYIETTQDNAYIAVKKKSIWAKYLVGVVILLLLCIIGYLVIYRETGPEIDPSIEDYVTSLKRPADLDSTQILVPGFNEWKMQAGTAGLNANLFNPEKNPCYFRFSIVDEKDGEVLYTSKLVPPGKGITNITLNKELPEGEYEITIRIETFDLNDYETPLNGANVGNKLIAIQ